MQENNNFETIIGSWRRWSTQQIDITNLESMSGDSPSHQTLKKKEEEPNLFVLERPKGPIATAASDIAVLPSADTPQNTNVTEDHADKQDLIGYGKENYQEEPGDTDFSKNEHDDKCLQADTPSVTSKSQESKWSNKDRGDKVDSVYLRPPPPHKVRSNVSSAEEDGCGMKCLYYTLLCCDCVLM